MMKKELPLKRIEEPEVFASGTESVVFKFKPEKGKDYVYKEVCPDARAVGGKYFGKTLEQKAASIKKAYEILKEYCGDKIADTHFIIGKNRKEDPCLIMVQEEIKGTSWSSMSYDDREGSKAEQQIKEVEETIPKILKDPRMAKYLDTEYSQLGDLTYSGNIIVNKKGNIKIIDW